MAVAVRAAGPGPGPRTSEGRRRGPGPLPARSPCLPAVRAPSGSGPPPRPGPALRSPPSVLRPQLRPARRAVPHRPSPRPGARGRCTHAVRRPFCAPPGYPASPERRVPARQGRRAGLPESPMRPHVRSRPLQVDVRPHSSQAPDGACPLVLSQ
ncbi:proline-rich protein HaeIII subfamily 1-like [Saccopteryx leptura]|uniref:proline-rich protein HaeIII subfamily 1-like n=1 Tax=Saccopteryx leptura TaxID=249018 RepID=UPI00339C62BB